MKMPRVMRRRQGAFVADVVAILVFVLIGRRVHDHGVSVTGLASTFWPFGVGLIGGWLVAIRRCLHVATLRGGGAIVIVTVVVGMLLRRLAGQGTATAFIVVAFAFLGASMLGWRLVYSLFARRR